jgi:hypothetical protein
VAGQGEGVAVTTGALRQDRGSTVPVTTTAALRKELAWRAAKAGRTSGPILMSVAGSTPSAMAALAGAA